jgi:sulfur relay (sulfurtransferase) complex TusBCD TusD component (DsrE family)
MMTPLTYTLVIKHDPDQHDKQRRALRFASALCKRGHLLRRVFFYGDGVKTVLPIHSTNVTNWQNLVTPPNAQCELILCSASVERLHVMSVPQHFVIGGLGSLIEAGFDSDRVINCD